MSAFEDWFVAQHGPRDSDARNDADLSLAVVAGERAARELRRRTEWDARRESALYAWQVNTHDRK